MKKFPVLFLLMICLCACGAKVQPAPTAVPAIVPTEIPEEVIRETVPAEPSPEEDNRSAVDQVMDVVNELSAAGERMQNSTAFLMLDTAGKKIWKAPLAGIEEFRVPDFMADAHGGIRAMGGRENVIGTGIVSLDVVYLSMTEAEYYDFLDRMAETANDTEDIDEEFGISRRFMEVAGEYNSHRHPLFSVYGIGMDQDENAILEAERNELASLQIFSDEEIEESIGGRTFTKIGNAEDYNFFFVQKGMDEEDLKKLESDGIVYKSEYMALFNARDQIVPNFTFMRPIGVQDLIAEGTGLSFETLDVFGNPVKSEDIFKDHKMTMLNIWATTCTACISEMPELIKLNREFEEKGGQIVSLVFDAVEEDLVVEAKEIVEDLGVDFLTILPNDYLRTTFDAMSYPITYFINEKGEIFGEPLMGANPARCREIMESCLSR